MAFSTDIPNLTDLTLAVTGHRPDKLGGYSEEVNWRLIKLAEFLIATAKPAKVITGMALGWDQAVAYAAIRAKVYTIAAIPFAGQESKWPSASQARYRTILAKCNERVVVSPGDFAGWKMQARNAWMVDRCDALGALWNGTEGGTYNCLEYAEKQEDPVTIFNLWKLWKDKYSTMEMPK
jgi:uncharacterized phage-like protein YoqJ